MSCHWQWSLSQRQKGNSSSHPRHVSQSHGETLLHTSHKGYGHTPTIPTSTEKTHKIGPEALGGAPVRKVLSLKTPVPKLSLQPDTMAHNSNAAAGKVAILGV